MGLVQHLTPSTVPLKSESEDNLINANVIATAVADTFVNRTAIAPQAYPEIFNQLSSYGEGIPITVEYFKRRGPFISTQTIDTSFSLERAAIHFSFDLVHNFEIRIKDQIEINTNTDAAETAVTGEGFVYPGFKPNVGDIFYLRLPDNNVGVFVVNLTSPLAITRGTYYQISFHLDSFLSEETDTKLRSAVSDELYFEKQHYFSDEAALLSSESYNQLQALVSYRRSIISQLVNKFYNTTERTIVRPDQVYDPFLVDYLQNKISIKDNRRDITQIANPYVDSCENMIWEAFIYKDIAKLTLAAYTLCTYQLILFDVGISDIDHYRLVFPVDKTTVLDGQRLMQEKFNTTDDKFRIVSYIFSDRFYSALFQSFENGVAVADASVVVDDNRICENLASTFYSVSDDAYHDMAFFDAHTKVTGSNNDIHLPEIEFLVFDYIVNENVNISYLLDKVLKRFPFKNMLPLDQLYTYALLINIIDDAIVRIR